MTPAIRRLTFKLAAGRSLVGVSHVVGLLVRRRRRRRRRVAMCLSRPHNGTLHESRANAAPLIHSSFEARLVTQVRGTASRDHDRADTRRQPGPAVDAAPPNLMCTRVNHARITGCRAQVTSLISVDAGAQTQSCHISSHGVSHGSQARPSHIARCPPCAQGGPADGRRPAGPVRECLQRTRSAHTAMPALRGPCLVHTLTRTTSGLKAELCRVALHAPGRQ